MKITSNLCSYIPEFSTIHSLSYLSKQDDEQFLQTHISTIKLFSNAWYFLKKSQLLVLFVDRSILILRNVSKLKKAWRKKWKRIFLLIFDYNIAMNLISQVLFHSSHIQTERFDICILSYSLERRAAYSVIHPQGH